MPADEDVEEAWEQELAQRAAEIDSGAVKLGTGTSSGASLSPLPTGRPATGSRSLSSWSRRAGSGQNEICLQSGANELCMTKFAARGRCWSSASLIGSPAYRTVSNR